MAETQNWVPLGIDTNVPSMARVYDYILGGAHNFAADRQVGAQIEKLVPGLPSVARLNRRFLGRAVNFLMDQGVRQFLDIGSGIPTVANVHEVAQERDPAARVVYVDKDPVAVAHSQLMLSDNENAAIVHADMRDPEVVLSSPRVKQLLRFDEPVGLLMLLMMHWVPDEDGPEKLVAHYRDALPMRQLPGDDARGEGPDRRQRRPGRRGGEPQQERRPDAHAHARAGQRVVRRVFAGRARSGRLRGVAPGRTWGFRRRGVDEHVLVRWGRS